MINRRQTVLIIAKIQIICHKRGRCQSICMLNNAFFKHTYYPICSKWRENLKDPAKTYATFCFYFTFAPDRTIFTCS